MTLEEKQPKILNGSRRKRIANGSGTSTGSQPADKAVWTNG